METKGTSDFAIVSSKKLDAGNIMRGFIGEYEADRRRVGERGSQRGAAKQNKASLAASDRKRLL